MFKRIFAILLAFFVMVASVSAATYSVTATTNSASQLIAPGLTSVTVTNNGNSFATVRAGTSGVTASDNDAQIPPHWSINVITTAATHLAYKIMGRGQSGNLSIVEDAVNPQVANPMVGDRKGSGTNDSAPAGAVGQYLSASLLAASGVAQTTATSANVVSMTVPAGDWDVDGVVDYGLTAATTTNASAGISTTSATLGAQDTYVKESLPLTAATDNFGVRTPHVRVSLAAPTTVYLISNITFSSGVAAASGLLRARLAR